MTKYDKIAAGKGELLKLRPVQTTPHRGRALRSVSRRGGQAYREERSVHCKG